MFEVTLEFKTENNILPTNLNDVFTSFMKEATSNYSNDFFNKIFDKANPHLKLYTFSQYLPGAKFKYDGEERICISENYFIINFSCYNTIDGINFFNSFLKMKNNKIKIKDNVIILNRVNLKESKEILNEEIIIKMKSPLLVRQHNKEENKDYYILKNDPSFLETIKDNIIAKSKYTKEQYDLNKFSIIPLDTKNVVINSFGRKVIGTIGVFKLTGDPKLLTLLYSAGIGSACGNGFGKFEVLA